MGELKALKTKPETSIEDMRHVLKEFTKLVEEGLVEGFIISASTKESMTVMATGLSGLEASGLLAQALQMLDQLTPMDD